MQEQGEDVDDRRARHRAAYPLRRAAPRSNHDEDDPDFVDGQIDSAQDNDVQDSDIQDDESPQDNEIQDDDGLQGDNIQDGSAQVNNDHADDPECNVCSTFTTTLINLNRLTH